MDFVSRSKSPNPLEKGALKVPLLGALFKGDLAARSREVPSLDVDNPGGNLPVRHCSRIMRDKTGGFHQLRFYPEMSIYGSFKGRAGLGRGKTGLRSQ
jgi:hypothetical protein